MKQAVLWSAARGQSMGSPGDDRCAQAGRQAPRILLTPHRIAVAALRYGCPMHRSPGSCEGFEGWLELLLNTIDYTPTQQRRCPPVPPVDHGRSRRGAVYQQHTGSQSVSPSRPLLISYPTRHRDRDPLTNPTGTSTDRTSRWISEA